MFKRDGREKPAGRRGSGACKGRMSCSSASPPKHALVESHHRIIVSITQAARTLTISFDTIILSSSNAMVIVCGIRP
jgi:hypothetical protein